MGQDPPTVLQNDNQNKCESFGNLQLQDEMTTERTHASASKGGLEVGEKDVRDMFQEDIWRVTEDLMGLLPLVIPAWDTKGSVLLCWSKLSHPKL